MISGNETRIINERPPYLDETTLSYVIQFRPCISSLLLVTIEDVQFENAITTYFSGTGISYVNLANIRNSNINNEPNTFDGAILRLTVDTMHLFYDALDYVIGHLKPAAQLVVGIVNAWIFNNGLSLEEAKKQLINRGIDIETVHFIRDQYVDLLLEPPESVSTSHQWENAAIEFIIKGTTSGYIPDNNSSSTIIITLHENSRNLINYLSILQQLLNDKFIKHEVILLCNKESVDESCLIKNLDNIKIINHSTQEYFNTITNVVQSLRSLYIIIMDERQLLSPQSIPHLVNIAQSDNKIGIIYCNIDNTNILENCVTKTQSSANKLSSFNKPLFAVRDVFLKAGGFTTTNNIDFLTKVYQHGYSTLMALVEISSGEGKNAKKHENSIKMQFVDQHMHSHNSYKNNKYHTKVSIIVLTYNKLAYTKLCLESILRYTDVDYQLIIVDNSSMDDTITYLKDFERAHKNVDIILNNENFGYAGANNIGIAKAVGDYILILNNDTVVTSGYLTQMLNHLSCNPSAGIIGPCSNSVTEPQRVLNTSYESLDRLNEYSRIYSRIHNGEVFKCPMVVGYCLLLKREVIDKIGGFDPRFKRGNFEDDDFCIRANIAGFDIIVAKDVFIHHYGRVSWTDDSNHAFYMLKNWQEFKSKWNITASRPIHQRYPIELLCRQVFNINKHYVPVVPTTNQDDIIKWGLRMYEEGKLLNAKASFEMVLEKDPDNLTARVKLLTLGEVL